MVTPSVAAPGRGRGRLGRGEQAGLGEVGGVGEAGGLADDDPDAGAPVAAGAELLDLAVVEGGRATAWRSSANTSAKSPPVRRAAPSTRSITSSGTRDTARSRGFEGCRPPAAQPVAGPTESDARRVQTVPLEPGSSASVDLDGRRRRHRHRHEVRLRARPRHPPRHRPERGGVHPRRSTAASRTARPRSASGCRSTTWRRPPVGQPGDGRGHARSRSGPPAHLHRVA